MGSLLKLRSLARPISALAWQRCLSRPQPLSFKPVILSRFASSAQLQDVNSTKAVENSIKTPTLEVKWADVEKLAPQFNDSLDITSAAIPFAHWGFLNWLFLPYTFAATYSLDFLLQHMPLWQAIIALTATYKVLTFPLVKRNRIALIKTNNIMPELSRLQQKVQDARLTGSKFDVAVAQTKVTLLHQKHGITNFDRFGAALLPTPMFYTFFWLLRTMSGAKVEAITSGGFAWFQDLSICDPTMMLPGMACLSTFLLMKFSDAPLDTIPFMRYVIYGSPFVIFYLIYDLPSAVMLFWISNNSLMAIQNLTLRSKRIKDWLGFPEQIVHPADATPRKSFMEQWSEAKQKATSSKTTEDLRRLDDIAFKQAGTGPLRKTYKLPPKSL